MASIVTPVLVGTMLNSTYALAEEGEPKAFRSALAGFLVMGALLATGKALPTIAYGLAILYAISSFLLHGTWLVSLLNGLVG